MLLVSACLLLTPSDKSCTSLLFARADPTPSGNPSTEEELYLAEGFLVSLQNWEIESLESGQVPHKYSAGCSLHSEVATKGI